MLYDVCECSLDRDCDHVDGSCVSSFFFEPSFLGDDDYIYAGSDFVFSSGTEAVKVTIKTFGNNTVKKIK
jgi:hypothetical protein